jgi:hypothetical protein
MRPGAANVGGKARPLRPGPARCRLVESIRRAASPILRRKPRVAMPSICMKRPEKSLESRSRLASAMVERAGAAPPGGKAAPDGATSTLRSVAEGRWLARGGQARLAGRSSRKPARLKERFVAARSIRKAKKLFRFEFGKRATDVMNDMAATEGQEQPAICDERKARALDRAVHFDSIHRPHRRLFICGK